MHLRGAALVRCVTLIGMLQLKTTLSDAVLAFCFVSQDFVPRGVRYEAPAMGCVCVRGLMCACVAR